MTNTSDAAGHAKDFLNPPRVVHVTDSNYHTPASRKIEMVSSIAIAPNGRLWAAWYAGPMPAEDNNNYVIVASSGDDGKTWSEHFQIDPQDQVRAYDPEIWVDPQGRLWVFWAQTCGHDGTVAGVWAMVTDQPDSADAKFSKPRRLTDGVMMCKPTVLANGQWLLPASTWRTTDNSARAVVSADHGKTFNLLGSSNVPKEDRIYDEHMIVEREDHSLWMLARTKYGIGQSFSKDGGQTWTQMAPTAIASPSSRFFIRRLISGNLLLVKNGPLNEKIGRSHMTAFLSKDDGASWQGGLLLDSRENVSYPDGDQSPDGTIYLTYDRDRTIAKEILLATFTEQDVLAGKAVSGKVRLMQLINQPVVD